MARSATVQKHSGGLFLFIFVIGLLGISAVIFLIGSVEQAPAYDIVIPQSHAVERHGNDAVKARLALHNCAEGLRSQLCPGKPGTYGLTVVFWCETGEYLCPGCYATIGGLEKTAFIRPCAQWRRCP